MSTLPDFTGPGFFAGEAPDGLTTIAGTPTSAQVRVYWRDPAEPDAPDVLVASTQSAADGTWQIAGLNPALRYVVRAQKSQFDDVTVVGAMPSRSDVIAYVNQLVPREDEFGDVDGLAGHVLLDSGLPPFTCEVIQPLPFGLTARVDGRKLLIEGASEDAGDWESVVRVTAGNGVWVDVLVVVQIQVPSDPHFDKVSLLLHMDGADGSTTFIDSSLAPKIITAHGNAKISTAHSKWGDASLLVDGNGDYLSFPPSDDHGFSAGDWTVEGFFLPTLRQTGNRFLLDMRAVAGASFMVWCSQNSAHNSLGYSTEVGTYFASGGSWSVGSFNHWAMTRASGTVRAFVNGALVFTTSDSRTYTGSQGGFIGSSTAANQGAIGYIDEVRITKGVARYTANFAPPDKPFPNR